MTYYSPYAYRRKESGFDGLKGRDVENAIQWLEETDPDRFVTVPAGYRGDVTRYVGPAYTLTKRKAFGSQREVMSAWEDMKFPRHNAERDGSGLSAEMYSSENFRAIQRTDGTGVVWHYRTIAAIRTRAGTVIANSQDYGNGFARVTYPDNHDGIIPLTTIRESGVLPDGMDVYDIVTVHRGRSFRDAFHSEPGRYGQRDGYPTLVELSDGSGLVIVRDPSAKNHHENTAMFHVSREEIQSADNVNQLEELLKPEPVRVAQARGMDLVTTDEMVPHRGRGGPSRYGSRGAVIQRQGEWYFIPESEDLADVEGGMSLTSGVPSKCVRCGATRFDVTDVASDCKECGHRHVIELPDETDEMGNHAPTHFLPAGNSGEEIACDGGHVVGYVRGTVRHTEEHYMARLGDTWHKAVTHDRDVVVVDTSTPTHGRARGMRWD